MSDILLRTARARLGGAGLVLLATAVAAGAAHAEPPRAWAALAATPGPAALEGSAPDAAGGDPFAGAPHLERTALVREVLRRNPSLESARAAWRAALARPGVERALPDPMLELSVGPWSFGSAMVDDAYRAELRQPLPFPGKLRLRGEIAQAEAEAAGLDYEAARVRLAQLAAVAFEDWAFAARASEILAAQLALLDELQSAATARYAAGLVSLDAPLQAEGERAMVEHRQVAIETDGRIAGERMNALLHRRPELPLPPPPPASEPPPMTMADVDVLAARALASRPELRAAAARAEARARGVDLARRELLPDFEVFGMYDSFMQENPLHGSVGVALNVPLNVARRRSAIAEARAELARAKSEHARTEDRIRLAVVSANERLREAHHRRELLHDRVVPAARDRIAAARAAFESGQESFLTVIDAERSLRAALLEQADADAELGRRHAELDRALGALPAGVEADPGADPEGEPR